MCKDNQKCTCGPVTESFDPADPFADLADLEDANEWRDDLPKVAPADVHKDLNRATVARFEERCKACNGTGVFTSWAGRTVGPCFKCKGKGVRYFRTSPEVRAEQNRRRIAKKEELRLAKQQAGRDWLEANEDVAAYLKEEAEKNNQWSQFPRDMLAAIEAYGHLTEKQEAAVRKGMARKAEWAAKNATEKNERVAREADTKLDLTRLLEVFTNASASGLKSPKLVVGNLRISLAKAHSKNPGHLYVNLNADEWDDRTYLGKISPAGEFFSVKACTAELFEEIKTLSGDVFAAAVAHGKKTGRCCCCNRELTNEESVELGIGPICRGKWGM